MSKFRHHKYTWARRFSSIKHNWELVGPFGALNFHVTVMDEDKYGDTAGLEFHHTQSPSYAPRRAPDHLDCQLTGGRCWHNGTLLYATETLWPRIKVYLEDGDHQLIFRMLEREYDKYFEPVEMGDG